MNRRQAIGVGALLLLKAAGMRAASAGNVNYTRSDFDAAIKNGQSLMLDFYAPW